MGLISSSGDTLADYAPSSPDDDGGTVSNDDATAQGDVINDVRSQIRPDVTDSPIEDSTSNADSNNVSVTGTGTPTVNISTPTGTTTVDRSGVSNDPQPDNTTSNSEPDNEPAQPPEPENSGNAPQLSGKVLAVIAAVVVLVLSGGLAVVFD